ncbi:Uncharacterised protein [Mycobacterium tuberculosis]|nr:Uncharacterised protein [Mycobacterium tuberculosis]
MLVIDTPVPIIDMWLLAIELTLLSGDRCGETAVHSPPSLEEGTTPCAGWASCCSAWGHIVHQLVRRGGVDGLLDRDGLLKEPAGVGDQWGVLERQQRLGRRRRRGGVAIHRLRVLAPHLAVCGLIGLDRRRVLPQEVGRGQRHQFGTVLGDHRRGHRQPIRRLVGRRSNPDLGGGQLGLPRGDAHPRHIRRGRRHHQTRRRTYPRPHRQTPDHRLKRRRGRKQVTRHAVPHLRGGHQRGRTRAGVHPRGVDLRW